MPRYTQITLQNVDTNVLRETVSNGAGAYFFSSLPPGHYTLDFNMQKFQSQRISAFEVAVDQTVTINATLRVGDVQMSVVVEAQGNLDTSIIRKFPIRDALQVELRAEAFNVLNHPVLGTPASAVTTPSSFGQITSTANSQRLMQFAAKVVF